MSQPGAVASGEAGQRVEQLQRDSGRAAPANGAPAMQHHANAAAAAGVGGAAPASSGAPAQAAPAQAARSNQTARFGWPTAAAFSAALSALATPASWWWNVLVREGAVAATPGSLDAPAAAAAAAPPAAAAAASPAGGLAPVVSSVAPPATPQQPTQAAAAAAGQAPPLSNTLDAPSDNAAAASALAVVAAAGGVHNVPQQPVLVPPVLQQPAAHPAAHPAAALPVMLPAAQPAAHAAAMPAAQPAAQPAAMPAAQPAAWPVLPPAAQPAAAVMMQSPQPKKKPSSSSRKKKKRGDEAPPRMCASQARKAFKLSDKDLQELDDVQYKPNPCYRSAAPMRLYRIDQLEELVQLKAERKAREAEERLEGAAARAAANAQRARERRAAAAAAAAEAITGFEAQPGAKSARHGSVVLPDTCLARIFGFLVDSLQPGGLRGPSAVARDLAAASLVCGDFYWAGKAAFACLSEAVSSSRLQQARPHEAYRLLSGLHSLPGEGRDWAWWDALLQRPTERNLKVQELKEAARHLGLQVSGTKPELVLRLLDAFDLSTPTTAPAQLLRALVLERNTQSVVWDGPRAAKALQSIQAAVGQLVCCGDARGYRLRDILQESGISAARMRRLILSAGFASVADLTAAGADCEQRRQAERQARRAERAARASVHSRYACEQCCEALDAEDALYNWRGIGPLCEDCIEDDPELAGLKWEAASEFERSYGHRWRSRDRY